MPYKGQRYDSNLFSHMQRLWVSLHRNNYYASVHTVVCLCCVCVECYSCSRTNEVQVRVSIGFLLCFLGF